MKKILVFIFIIITIILLTGTGYVWFNLKTPEGKSSTESFFEIKEGESTLEIAKNLKTHEFIRSPWFLTIYVHFRKINLLPGLYYLRENMDLSEIIQQISKGKVQEYKITIPEGWTNKQIGKYLEDKEILKSADFLLAAEGKEGYLFPDTYRISAKASANNIVSIMEKNFQKRTEGLDVTKDTIVLASIVEKEAKTDQDKKIVAGVYLKRLELNMMMESCPTVLYAMGITKSKLTFQDISFNSPYNTYIHKGLPPGPICNPGLDSIKAVLEPTSTPYLYFLSDSEGNLHYAKTNSEQNQNKQKYGL